MKGRRVPCRWGCQSLPGEGLGLRVWGFKCLWGMWWGASGSWVLLKLTWEESTTPVLVYSLFVWLGKVTKNSLYQLSARLPDSIR